MSDLSIRDYNVNEYLKSTVPFKDRLFICKIRPLILLLNICIILYSLYSKNFLSIYIYTILLIFSIFLLSIRTKFSTKSKLVVSLLDEKLVFYRDRVIRNSLYRKEYITINLVDILYCKRVGNNLLFLCKYNQTYSEYNDISAINSLLSSNKFGILKFSLDSTDLSILIEGMKSIYIGG